MKNDKRSMFQTNVFFTKKMGQHMEDTIKNYHNLNFKVLNYY